MKKGFTLIELLVVVLIIGILSGIALPQYTAAVEKARASEVVSLMASAEKAADLYVLQEGYPSTGLVELVGKRNGVASGKLDIDIEAALSCQTNNDRCESKDFSYDVYCGTSTCTWTAEQLKGDYDMSGHRSRGGKWMRSCNYYTKAGRVVCESLRGQGWSASDNM